MDMSSISAEGDGRDVLVVLVRMQSTSYHLELKIVNSELSVMYMNMCFIYHMMYV